MKSVRVLTVLLTVVVATSLFAAGGKEARARTAEGGPVTLTYFQHLGDRAPHVMQTYSEMYMFQVMEEKFNVKFDFVHPPGGQVNEQFNLMIASQDLTDLIMYNFGNAPGGPEKLISDRVILRLNDLLRTSAPNLLAMLAEHPDAQRQVVTSDGSYYMFPMLRIPANTRINAGPAIRQDWLDRLGLEKPETIDEWYTVLTAFKNQDANGNGDPTDEIPIVSIGDDIFRRVFIAAWRMRYDFFIREDGRIGWGAIEPQFKDFLETMAKWYREGLIDPDYITTDGTSFDAKVTGNRGGALWAWMNGNIGRYNTVMRDDPSFDLRGVMWPRSSDGISYTVHIDMARMTDGQGVALSTKNAHRELSATVLDYLYGEEGNLLANFGKLGVSYEIVNGEVRFTDLILNNPDGLSPTQALTKFNMGGSGSGGAFNQDARYASGLREAIPQQLYSEADWAQSRLGVVPPPLLPAQADSARLARIMNEVNTYVSEMTNKIIMGIEPVSVFDAFVLTQKRMNIEDAIAIQQRAYDDYLGR